MEKDDFTIDFLKLKNWSQMQSSSNLSAVTYGIEATLGLLLHCLSLIFVVCEIDTLTPDLLDYCMDHITHEQ